MSYIFKKENGEFALIRCPKCHKENYALNVMSGICTWCGYDINKDKRNETSHDTET